MIHTSSGRLGRFDSGLVILPTVLPHWTWVQIRSYLQFDPWGCTALLRALEQQGWSPWNPRHQLSKQYLQNTRTLQMFLTMGGRHTSCTQPPLLLQMPHRLPDRGRDSIWPIYSLSEPKWEALPENLKKGFIHVLSMNSDFLCDEEEWLLHLCMDY